MRIGLAIRRAEAFKDGFPAYSRHLLYDLLFASSLFSIPRLYRLEAASEVVDMPPEGFIPLKVPA